MIKSKMKDFARGAWARHVRIGFLMHQKGVSRCIGTGILRILGMPHAYLKDLGEPLMRQADDLNSL